MKTFEEIINYSYINNIQGFENLKEYIKNDINEIKGERKGIIAYIGTGLSFYYKSWGEPFKEIKDKLITDSVLKKYIKHKKIKDKSVDDYKLYLDNLYRDEKFMEMGEELNSILIECDSMTFNAYFNDMICEKENETLIKYDETQSIFLLPYLSYRFIATNCDDSINTAFSICDINSPQNFGNNRDMLHFVGSASHSSPYIVNIHGYRGQHNLIMIDSDYLNNYQKRVKGRLIINYRKPIPKFLSDSAEKYNFIFLGASLNQTDLAVQILKKSLPSENTNIDRKFKSTKHIAFFKLEKDEIDTKRDEMINNYRIRPIFTKDYEDQAIILRQAIREVKNEFWNQNIYSATSTCKNCKLKCVDCKKVLKKVKLIMENNEVLDSTIISLEEEKFLSETLFNYLYNSGNVRTYNWRVCRVNSKFGFNYSTPEYDPKNYNLPLGNTIYVIGGDQMDNGRVKTIVDDIKDWCTGREFKNKYSNIKIRIIEIESKKTERELTEIKDIEIRAKLQSIKEILVFKNEIKQEELYHIRCYFDELVKTIYDRKNFENEIIEIEKIFESYEFRPKIYSDLSDGRSKVKEK